MLRFLLHLLILFFFFPSSSSSIGINYGQIANNLPSPSTALSLLASIPATKLKLYDANPTILSTFSTIDLTIAVPPSTSPLPWLRSHLPSTPTSISTLTVANEVLSSNSSSAISSLLPSIKAVHSAARELGLSVAVTTAHSLAVLETSFPPSEGRFREDVVGLMEPLLEFLAETGAPFLINAYPFFAYKADPESVSLEYVTFEPNEGVVDQGNGLVYHNMLFAQVDAVHVAIKRVLGEKKANMVKVVVSETGWPSKGDEDEFGATPENARKYNQNLIKLVEEKKGTPLKPHLPLEVYVFALFNENLKPGPTSERNYGLFKPDGTPAYEFSVKTMLNDNATTQGDGGGASASAPAPMASMDYYSISSAEKVEIWRYFPGSFFVMGLIWRLLLAA